MSILSNLNSQERISARKLTEAFDLARNGYSVTRRDRLLIRPSQDIELNGANPFARILLGRKLWSEFEDHFNLSTSRPIPDCPLFWLTLTDLSCMTALDSKDADIPIMTRKLRHGLEGLSYVGVMDLALYANIQPGTQYKKKTGINWHLHLFAWGEDRRDMKLRAEYMNELPCAYRPIDPKKFGFHWKQMTAASITWRFPYMLKTPRKSYRIGRRANVDEIRFRSNRGDLRPGQRITLFHLLKHHLLDDLFIAGGAGVEMRRRAIRSAVSQIR